MRIAFDLHATVGRATGIGVHARSLWDALHRLAPEDLDLQALGLDGPGAGPGTMRRLWWEQFRLPRLMEETEADLVHLTGFAVPWRRRRPVLLTVHDLIGMRIPVKGIGAGLYWGRILPATVPWARAVVAVSEATKRDCCELLGLSPSKITVIPNGVEPRFRPPVASEQEAFRRRFEIRREYLLAVASLAPRKNLPLLVEAFAALAAPGQACADLDLLLAGKAAGDRGAIEAVIARHGLEERVRLLGYVPDAELPGLYGCSRAFVYPSSYEGFGLPVLEALACGVPCLTTRVSALPEAGGELARYVEAPVTVEGLAGALCDLLAEKELAGQIVEEGPRRAARFTWDEAARRHVELYRRLVS